MSLLLNLADPNFSNINCCIFKELPVQLLSKFLEERILKIYLNGSADLNSAIKFYGENFYLSSS